MARAISIRLDPVEGLSFRIARSSESSIIRGLLLPEKGIADAEHHGNVPQR